MALFVHLTSRNGSGFVATASRLRRPWGAFPGGVFAVPVTGNFYISHQWLRELKRRNAGPIAAVTFRIPDDERVWVGHYNQAHRWMTAAEAVAEFRADPPREGWQVVIPRRIAAAEIHRTRSLPQGVGWRYYPGAHHARPCSCDFCQRGQYGGGAIRERRKVSG
ncbi:MAG: hypothetical protein U0736_25645 [Gemmataceae bacterium]